MDIIDVMQMNSVLECLERDKKYVFTIAMDCTTSEYTIGGGGNENYTINLFDVHELLLDPGFCEAIHTCLEGELMFISEDDGNALTTGTDGGVYVSVVSGAYWDDEENELIIQFTDGSDVVIPIIDQIGTFISDFDITDGVTTTTINNHGSVTFAGSGLIVADVTSSTVTYSIDISGTSEGDVLKIVGGVLVFDQESNVTDFLGLTDTPNDYTGQTGKFVRVNAGETGLEFHTLTFPVTSVNTQTGVVVLDADDINDAATTHKFVTSTDLANLANLSGTNSGDVSLAGTPNYLSIAGQVITRNLIDLTSHITGNLSVSHLNGGSGASSATFWRGDGTWATPAGSGDVSKVGTPVDNQIAVWTGNGTVEGSTLLTFDGTTFNITGNISVSGTVDGRDVATDGSKLDGIENGAEVNNISDANATDLTDGGDTTLHTHDGRYYTESEVDTLLNAKQPDIQFKDEGTNTGTAGGVINVDFVGAGVTASETGGTLTVTIPGSSGGDVSKVGTPVNNQIAVRTGAGTVEGTSDFTWDSTSNILSLGDGAGGTGTIIGSNAVGATSNGTSLEFYGGSGGATSGNGGGFYIFGGAALGGNSNGGEIYIVGGTKTGSGVSGSIYLAEGNEVNYIEITPSRYRIANGFDRTYQMRANGVWGILDFNGVTGSDKIFTLPNATGTIALTSDITGTNSGTNTGDQNLFSTIAVSGQSNVVADSTGDTLTLVAGTNVTITTDAATDTITINATGGGTPGGSDTQMQFNDGGSFAGIAEVTWDKTDKLFSIDITDDEVSPTSYFQGYVHTTGDTEYSFFAITRNEALFQTSGDLIFEGGTTSFNSADGLYTFDGLIAACDLDASALTGNRILTLPDATGTIALTSDITVTPTSTNTLTNKTYQLNPSPSTDHTASGVITSVIVDVNAAGIGAPLRIAADGNYETCDASSTSTMPCVALATETGTGTKIILNQGYFRDDTRNRTVGGQIYISTTTGTLTQTAPSASGEVVQVVGYAISADIIYFSPNLATVVIV